MFSVEILFFNEVARLVGLFLWPLLVALLASVIFPALIRPYKGEDDHRA